MATKGIARTDVGLGREGNEDAYLVDSELGLYVVCDGMGSHAADEVASAMAISSIERSARERRGVIAQVAQSPVLFADGLSDHIPSAAWLSEQSSASIEQLPDDLVDFALSCGGHDNITVIAVQVDEEPATIDHDGVRLPVQLSTETAPQP